MKRRGELTVRPVTEDTGEDEGGASPLYEEDSRGADLHHQRHGSQLHHVEDGRQRAPVAKRRRITRITTVTTVVTEDVGSGEEAEHLSSSSTSSEERRRLLKQLQALQEQLLAEERQNLRRHHPEHHHHHQHTTTTSVPDHRHQGHPGHTGHTIHRDDQRAHDTISRVHHHVPQQHQDADNQDHDLTQRPPFSATPSHTRVARSSQSSHRDRQVEVLEKGHIYFLYRPKVGAQEAHSFDDVARMYILLKTLTADEGDPSEEEGSARSFYRLIRIGKKKLPSIREHNRFWGIIEEATYDYDKIHHLIVSEHYTTLSLGERVAPSCRPAGEGVYGIVKRDDYTHLAYVLELPHALGEVQKALNIGAEGCFILSVKNPQALPYAGYSATVTPKPVPNVATDYGIPLPATDNRRAVQQLINEQPGLPRRDPATVPQSPLHVEFAPHVQEAFQGRRFAPALPLEMLDQKGVEVVIIGESDNVVAEFGKVGRELEGETIYAQNFTDEDLFKELHITKSENPIAPLRYGTWA